jgi:hypothetical protein
LRSAGGKTAISASILAEMTTAPAPSALALASIFLENSFPVAAEASSTLQT